MFIKIKIILTLLTISPAYPPNRTGRFNEPRSPQTEPVDFSAPPRPLGFGILGSMGGPTQYSRESTPDSGASHYMDSYRDHSGKNTLNFLHPYYIYIHTLRNNSFNLLSLHSQ